jgi:hypothetical protein
MANANAFQCTDPPGGLQALSVILRKPKFCAVFSVTKLRSRAESYLTGGLSIAANLFQFLGVWSAPAVYLGCHIVRAIHLIGGGDVRTVVRQKASLVAIGTLF